MSKTKLTKNEIEELRQIETSGRGFRRSYDSRSPGARIRNREFLSPLHREIYLSYKKSRPTWSEEVLYFVSLRQLKRIRRLAATPA